MLLAGGMFIGAYAMADLTDAEWKAMKEAALAKPRPVIANNDGCDATAFPKSDKNQKITLEQFHNLYLANFKDSKVTTMTYTPYSVGLGLSIPTKVSEQIFVDMPWIKHYNVVNELIELTGKDPMQLALEYARKNNIEFFASIRANDCHDMHFKGFLGNMKKSHPDWLVGSLENRPPRGEWTAFDFAHPEVRKLFVGVVTEIMEKYDLDGVEIDFCRMTLYFKSVAWNKPVSQAELDGMTDAIRQIRANAERIGRARKHPMILLFHLPDNPGVCREMGLDVETWMSEGLFDIYVAGSDRGNYNTAENVAALCNKYGIQFYAGVCDPYRFSGVFARHELAAYHAEQAYRLAAGAKGTWLFNMHYSKQCLHGIARDLDELKFKNKVYFTAHQHENNYGVKPDAYIKHNNVPELSPWKEFYGARKKDYIIQVGDDFNDPELLALDPDEYPQVTLYIDVRGKLDHLKVSFNGNLLKPGKIAGTVVSYPVSTSIIKKGVNILTLDSTAAEGTFGGHRLLFDGRSFPGGRPWWGIYRVSVPNAKSVKDGAVFLNDYLAMIGKISAADMETKNTGKVNAFRTFSGIEGTPFRVVFDLKTAEGNDPETSMIRLADEQNLEIVDFRPNKIVLKYAKKQVKFNTADKFHRYSLTFDNGKLTLIADGKKLFDNVPMPVKVGDPRTVLLGHNYMIPADTNRASMVIGSLNGPGTGSSLWKNFHMYSDMLVADAALHVTFPPRIPAEIKKVGKNIEKWTSEFDFASGKVDRKKFSSTYKQTPAVKGGIMLDNENNKENQYMGMNLIDQEVICSSSRFRTAEWEVEAVRPSAASKEQMVFQMCFRVGTSPDSYINAIFACNANTVETAWGSSTISKGSHKYRMIVDTVDKNGVIFVDGVPLFAGELKEEKGKPVVCWGDLSSGVGGAAVLKNVRFSAYPSVSEDFKAVKKRIGSWDTELDFSNGTLPQAEGFSSNYPVKTAVDGNFLLDNESAGEYNGMFWNSESFTDGQKRYRVASWEVSPVKDAENKNFSVFQFVTKINTADGVVTAYCECNSREVKTPWGNLPAVSGAMRFTMIVDTQAKTAAIFLNDELLSCGLMPVKSDDKPRVMWGDLSGSVGGSASLKKVCFVELD